MALDSYDGLKTAILGTLDHPNLTEKVDDFIDLCETDLRRVVRIRQLLAFSTLAIAEDDYRVALPDDFLDLKYLRLQVPTGSSAGYGSRRYFPNFDQVTVDQITEHSTTTKSTPCEFAVDVEIEFNCPADQAYTAGILYYKDWTRLSENNESNEILVAAPDLYLYGALSHSAPFLMHDERIEMWKTFFGDGVEKANAMDREAHRGGPLVARVPGLPRHH